MIIQRGIGAPAREIDSAPAGESASAGGDHQAVISIGTKMNLRMWRIWFDFPCLKRNSLTYRMDDAEFLWARTFDWSANGRLFLKQEFHRFNAWISMEAADHAFIAQGIA